MTTQAPKTPKAKNGFLIRQNKQSGAINQGLIFLLVAINIGVFVLAMKFCSEKKMQTDGRSVLSEVRWEQVPDWSKVGLIVAVSILVSIGIVGGANQRK